jgi:hypothetical protein
MDGSRFDQWAKQLSAGVPRRAVMKAAAAAAVGGALTRVGTGQVGATHGGSHQPPFTPGTCRVRGEFVFLQELRACGPAEEGCCDPNAGLVCCSTIPGFDPHCRTLADCLALSPSP